MKVKIFKTITLTLLICITALLIPEQTRAQNYQDALRYSQLDYTGATARNLALGGAFGAVGADLSSLSQNPAGIGLYRRSQFVFTPSLLFTNTEANFLGQTNTAKNNRFQLSNIGFVIAKKPNSNRRFNKHSKYNEGNNKLPESDWRYVNYSLAFNRLADFNAKRSMQGYNEANSIANYYVEQANALGYSANDIRDALPFGAGLAYYNYLISPVQGNDDNTYYTSIQAGVRQNEELIETGGLSELSFGVGANYQDQLYIGASLGMPFFRYTSERNYQESEIVDTVYNVSTFYQRDYLEAEGSGINLKLGLVYRLANNLRVGMHIHTPTLYEIEETFSTYMTTTFSDNQTENDQSTSDFSYQLVNPWRIGASGAFFINKAGFISLDYEYIDYTAANFDFDDFNISGSQANTSIDNNLNNAHNIRVGAEAAVDRFRIRAGYAFLGSPYASASSLTQQTISGGLGLREKDFFLDIAYLHQLGENEYTPYQLSNANNPIASIDKQVGRVVLTAGFDF